jgi:phage terminase large subunit GpA-like protein
MRAQPAKWVAENPQAYDKGCRSFWLNAFSSPWTPWSKIILSFLESKDDPSRLKVVYNTLFGKLWEDRGDLESEDEMLERRETYGTNEKGLQIELPDGVLCLTMGVDTQDNRLEYEVVGWGLYGESWGIQRGVIMGRPDLDETWQRLDDAIAHVYRFKDGKGLKISLTFIDSGGHFTGEVYKRCKERRNKRVFAIKGKSEDSRPFVTPPNKVYSDSTLRKKKDVWLYTIGVDSGKEMIMDSLKVQQPGPKYCHFPRDNGKGYDEYFFNSLLSERLEQTTTKRGTHFAWVKIPGHERNEALDCRNYALAAFAVLNPDMEQLQKRINDYRHGIVEEEKPKPKKAPSKRRTNKNKYFDEW